MEIMRTTCVCMCCAAVDGFRVFSVCLNWIRDRKKSLDACSAPSCAWHKMVAAKRPRFCIVFGFFFVCYFSWLIILSGFLCMTQSHKDEYARIEETEHRVTGSQTELMRKQSYHHTTQIYYVSCVCLLFAADMSDKQVKNQFGKCNIVYCVYYLC